MNLFSISEWSMIEIATLVAGCSTVAIYSFLYKENPLYRFFEHLFIGIATSITIMKTFRDFIYPAFFAPLFGQDRIQFPDGTYAEEYNSMLLLYFIPIAIGLLYYFILNKRHSWLAQIPIGLSLGAGAGLAFKGFYNNIMPQLYDSFKPLYIVGNNYQSFSNIVFVITLLTALSYFFFTFKQKPGGVMQRSSSMGRLLMMGCFGAFFGSTIMARMALLVERLQFLINDWWVLIF